MKVVKYFFEALVIYILFFLFRIFGIKFSRKFSCFLVLKIGFIFRKKKIIRNNILKVFKEYSDLEINNLINKMWSNYGLTFAEYIFLDKFRFNKFKQDHIEISGKEIIDNIKKKGKPVIFISAHLGNFELMAMELEKKGINLATIYRPLNNFFLNPFMVYLRKKYICTKQIKKGLIGTRETINYLKNNNSIALMVDQRVGESERCPFFNIPAHTTTIPAQLAVKYDLEIIPIFLERQKDNFFKMEIQKPIEYHKTENSDENKRKITIEINKTIEKMILRNPSQWIWTHSRWK
ncbi:MAG: lipid A biosynthesis acyltransferase [Candidatus Pelagibacter sp. TMED196]|nr:MAG: lipid A biosynthesis acyltransferase [Candidatus Pelagibacter sp. TMED196]|tara:strand:+ start:174 stop:1049 length:876 start_codon:yes stop_codon:yes gene_type:complete